MIIQDSLQPMLDKWLSDQDVKVIHDNGQYLVTYGKSPNEGILRTFENLVDAYEYALNTWLECFVFDISENKDGHHE